MSEQDLFENWYVKLDGSSMSEQMRNDLLEVTVESSLHLPDIATILLHDYHLKWIDDSLLKPGTSVEITVKNQQAENTLFNGEIVELEPDFGPEGHVLTVRAFNRLHRLARGRYVRTWNNVSDSDLVQKIASTVSLTPNSDSTPVVHEYVMQSNETNLEFLRGRAAALGFVLYVRDHVLHFEAPKAQGSPNTLSRERDLVRFHPRLTTVDQVNEVNVRGWDPQQKQAVVGQASSPDGSPTIGMPGTGSSIAQEAFGSASGLITNRPIRIQEVATKLAQAHMDRRASHYVEADGECAGNPQIISGTSVQIEKVGDRFSGTYLVTSATHRYDTDGYSTRFSVTGRHPDNLLSLLEPERDTAPLVGPVVGVVTDNNDPKGQGRVKVKFPWLADDHASDWARVVTPGAGTSRGIQFLPEVNDEVLVDFEMGDINYPYVLGGLWNGQDALPKSSSEAVKAGKVQQRVIYTRAGHFIALDDTETKGTIVIKSVAGHTITLDDAEAGGGITIQDKNANKIVLDDAPGNSNITIQDMSGNKIVLNAVQNSLTIQVSGRASMQALSVAINAQADVSIQAQGLLSLQSSGIVEIKGSLVKIN